MFYLSVSTLNKFLGLSAPIPVRLFFRNLVCFGGLMPFGDCHQDSALASSRFFGLFRREGMGSFVCSET